MPVVLHFRDLGADASLAGKMHGGTIAARIDCGVEVCRVIRGLPASYERKIQLITGKVLPASLYGAATSPVSQKKMHSLKTAITEVANEGAARTRS
eukprot:9272182-Alexandrium_andersonii.AAC.1